MLSSYTYFCRHCRALLLLLAFVSVSGYAQRDILAKLVHSKGADKLTNLEIWCNKNLFYSGKSEKIKLLNQLEQLALKKDDKITQASVIFYRGLYVMAMDARQHNQGVTTMLNGIALAEKNKQQLQAAYFRHSLGYYYFTSKKDYVPALQNMLRAHYIFKQVGYRDVNDQDGKLDRLAFVYYHLNNFNESIRNLHLSLKYPIKSKRRHISLLNTIGQSYRELFEPDSARKYFRLSRELALRSKDTAWIGITSGNLGRLYLSENSYAKAKPFMQEYYECSLATKDSALVIEALAGLGDIARASGQVDLALQNLKQAETILDKAFVSGDMPFESYMRKQYLYSVYSRTWDARGDAVRSLIYLKEANKIKDSIERRAKLSKNTAIQQLFEAEQTNNQFRLLEKEKQTAVMKQYLLIAIGLLFIIIFALLYSRQIRERKIQKQKENLLKLEKEKAQSDLQYAQEQLEEYLRNIRQKTEMLDNTQSEMDSLRQQYRIPAEDEQAVLQKLSYATILTDDDWTKFKILFEKVHAGFFLKLKAAYPGLTPAETRLCCLIKLGLNSHEMAAMMGISTMSIKKNRQRLRKKISLDETQKLEALFSNF